jgi:hypothetical protein
MGQVGADARQPTFKIVLRHVHGIQESGHEQGFALASYEPMVASRRRDYLLRS